MDNKAQQKYLLINIQTNEKHLCDKVTIDGFDYYVTEYKIKKEGQYCVDINGNIFKDENHFPISIGQRMILCTNNPNIDIPKVADEVKMLAEEASQGYSYPDFSKDNWTEGYNKAKEAHPFSEEDMIEFLDFSKSTNQKKSLYEMGCLLKGEPIKSSEILKLWKEQQPIKLFFKP